MKQRREQWVDSIKVIACALVALGHCCQGLKSAEILPAGALYNWLNQTLYFFHVALFFFCSGYLYQKHTVVSDLKSWGKNIYKKFIGLGVPYFSFSLLTWLVKMLFSGEVNKQNEDLLKSLFVEPMSPYWYLYILFLLFLITPTIKNKKMGIIMGVVALGMKLIAIAVGETGCYAFDKVMDREIWFCAGMIAADRFSQPVKENNIKKSIGLALLGVFFVLSVLLTGKTYVDGMISFGMGILGCLSLILLVYNMSKQGLLTKLFAWASRCTMPIFLMHTIFAAGIRSVLLRLGIELAWVHVIFGMLASFAGPILMAMLMERVKGLDFFMYPTKYLNKRPSLEKSGNN